MRVKTRTIQNLFVFLLLSLGILFVVLLLRTGKVRYMTVRLLEPFQTPDELVQKLREDSCEDKKRKCEPKRFQDNTFWLCEDDESGDTGYNRAMNILTMCSDNPFSSLAPKYVSLIRSGDTACYVAENSDTYVCFQRPPSQTYNPDFQSYVDIMSQDDTTPEELSNELPAVCSAYQGAVNMILRTFSTTTVNYNKVNSAIQRMADSYSTLNGTSVINCQTGSKSPSQTTACDTLRGFLTTYSVAPTGGTSNMSNLYTIRNNMSNALFQLQSTFTNQIKPQFNGFGCELPALQTPPGFVL